MVGSSPSQGSIPEITPEEALRAAQRMSEAAARVDAPPCGLARVLEALSIKEAAREHHNFLKESP